jgi:hypothetical protein
MPVTLKPTLDAFTNGLAIETELAEDRRDRQSLSVKIKYHDDFPKLDHNPAPSCSAEQDWVIDSPPMPKGAPRRWATRSTGDFSNGTSGENYSGINMPMTNRFGVLLNPQDVRWAAAERVSETVIAAVLLLHERCVDEIAPKLSAMEVMSIECQELVPRHRGFDSLNSV